MGNRVNMKVVESVWDKMENAHKQNQQPVLKEQDTIQTGEKNNGTFLIILVKFTEQKE